MGTGLNRVGDRLNVMGVVYILHFYLMLCDLTSIHALPTESKLRVEVSITTFQESLMAASSSAPPAGSCFDAVEFLSLMLRSEAFSWSASTQVMARNVNRGTGQISWGYCISYYTFILCCVV
jgi:hypothetical protein